MAKAKNRVNIVYSTNPDFSYEVESHEEAETLPAKDQRLYVELDKKGRAGKQVTLISGFIGRQADLSELGKQLKALCGAGGSTEGMQILVQGDHREKVLKFLISKGYLAKKRGG